VKWATRPPIKEDAAVRTPAKRVSAIAHRHDYSTILLAVHSENYMVQRHAEVSAVLFGV